MGMGFPGSEWGAPWGSPCRRSMYQVQVQHPWDLPSLHMERSGAVGLKPHRTIEWGFSPPGLLQKPQQTPPPEMSCTHGHACVRCVPWGRERLPFPGISPGKVHCSRDFETED